MNNVFVFDTNTFVSAILSPKSTNAQAIVLAENIGKIVFSSETFLELSEVLLRKKFDKYFTIKFRSELLERVFLRYNFVEPSIKITECRDFKDNKFLELAVESKASYVISGDTDLLELNPFRDIKILNARDFINSF